MHIFMSLFCAFLCFFLVVFHVSYIYPGFVLHFLESSLCGHFASCLGHFTFCDHKLSFCFSSLLLSLFLYLCRLVVGDSFCDILQVNHWEPPPLGLLHLCPLRPFKNLSMIMILYSFSSLYVTSLCQSLCCSV